MIESVKNLPNDSGIYMIKSPTGLVYIGEAKNLKTRCKSYINPKNVKNQRAIYNSLIKHGVDSHELQVLEICEENHLLEKERFYQELYNSVNEGLNCFFTGTDVHKKKWSDETKKKFSENQKGEKNSFYGKKHTKESLNKISENSKGEKNPNYGGKLLNAEYLKKQIESNSKEPLKVTDIFTKEVFYFINSKECANFFKCSPSTVRMSKNKFKLKRKYLVESNDIV